MGSAPMAFWTILKCHEIGVLVTEAKFSELPKGIAQNIAQLYTAIELASIASQKVGKRKRGDSDTSDAELDVAYGIVTTADPANLSILA
ncbi:hypothetical protein BC936DRAFT_147025 [Jimgerdemannia flammicorona]|uniref:Uncharacterized protein n=1 Tax=Jimgerdemannia flammicorona TaxID=994334 RepID=A0A433D6Z8_9FUNG|nr:hypothetical protein BC936DRAFT_147025 [Jimgerdemannia flammicorona]